MRSKFPLPLITSLMLTGSPNFTRSGVPVALNSNFPIAPEKSFGLPSTGSGFTSISSTGAVTVISVADPMPRPKRSNGCRPRCGRDTTRFAGTGPIAIFPALPGVITVLNVARTYGLPSSVTLRSEGFPNGRVVNPSPVCAGMARKSQRDVPSR